MNDLIPAVSQVGFPIVIATFLLWDYSKKLAAMQIELVKITDKMTEKCLEQDKIMQKLEKLEDILERRN